MAATKRTAAKVKNPAPAKAEQTPMVSVKVDDKFHEDWPLKRGDTFLFIKDGEKVYLTRSVAHVLLIRNSASVVIPKGSEFVPPKGTSCDGC